MGQKIVSSALVFNVNVPVDHYFFYENCENFLVLQVPYSA